MARPIPKPKKKGPKKKKPAPVSPEIREKRRRIMLSYQHVFDHIFKGWSPTNILEWGTGVSTRMFLERFPDVKLTSIEHSGEWYRKVKPSFEEHDNAQLLLLPLSFRGGKSQGYIAWPLRALRTKKTLRYDLIFVDGRSRCDCLTIAREVLAQNGLVVLHDAHRKAYGPGVDLFPHVRKYEKIRTTVMALNPEAMQRLDGFGDREP